MASSLNIVEVARVTPSSNSAESLTLPLTFFDLLWLKFPPVERVFFYRLTTESTREFFDSVVLPSLKSSLSLALSHFLPLAGRLLWDPQEPKPSIVYSPDDAVSLTVAESTADFFHLSADGPRDATGLYPLVPNLPVSDNSASVISLQVTLFPNQGFCISISAHHAVLDGKTTTMFLKAWAHLCKRQALRQEQRANNSSPSLPQDLTPFYDRTALNSPVGLEEKIVNMWLSLTGKLTGEEDLNRCKSLKLIPFPKIGPDVVRVTFELTRKDIQTLRDRVKNKKSSSSPEEKSKELRLSNFVITLAYVFTNMVRTRGGDPQRQVAMGFAADCRSRLNPPIPENYFGNGVAGAVNPQLKAKQIQEENGFVLAVETASDMVMGLDSWTPEEIPEILEKFAKVPPGTQTASVAGSTRFGVYGSDFGWGRPEKVEVVSIDKGEAISMAESRDGISGGVEIGLSLAKHEMEILIRLLRDGLKN